MNESMDAAVHFRVDREAFAADSDIVCRFEYVHCDPRPGDVVAIKKINWKAHELQNFLVSVSASDAVHDTSTGNTMRVAFSPALFEGKRTGDDLFQFCFISGDQLHGASTTFTIIRPKEGDYADFSRDEDVNDDDGFVVLKSPQAQFQDKIEELQTQLNGCKEENEQLTQKVQLLEKERCRLTQEKEAVQQDRDVIAAKADASQQREENLEQTLEEAIQNHMRLEKKSSAVLEKEKKKYEDMLRAFEEKSHDLTRVRAENAELRKRVDDLTQRGREDEQFFEANELMMKALKDDVKNIEHEKGVAIAQRDSAITSLQTVQQALDRETDLRKQEQEKSKAQEALLQRTVDDRELRLKIAEDEYRVKAIDAEKLEGKLRRLREKMNQFRTAPKNRSSSDPAAQPLNDPVEESAPVASAADPQPHSDENVSVPCGVCNKEVPYRDWETHLAEEHQQLMCPICCQTFPKNVSGMDSSFHVHVEYHFDPVRYPTTS